MKILTAEQVARLYEVSHATVTYWCRKGYLAGAQRVGRDWGIPVEELANFTRPKRGGRRKKGRKASKSPL